ncbi:MAG: efflux RND transporter periplasmic adaptor subunit [Gemmatimonadetes bacterium]|nr:efflux RND transporter periplasmic adaptor subunit [Gemmatimonadota bacterium]
MPEAMDKTGASAPDKGIFGTKPRNHAARLRAVVLGIAVIAGAVGVAFYAGRGKAPPAEGAGHQHGAAAGADAAQPVMLTSEQARRIGVTYAAVERSALAQEIRTVAQVTFDETRVRAVTLKFDGWIDRLFVDYTGRDVRAGEPLVSTYAPMLLSAEEELAIASRLARDVAGTDAAAAANARSLLTAARQRLLNWDVPAAEVERVERTGEAQKSLMIRAPYSGVVVDKLVLQGQRVMAGDPLFRIADLSVVWVEGEVFERDLALVHVGEAVDVELQALPGVTRRGRIVFLQPTVNNETRTVRVRVELENASGALKPGMYATIHIRSAGGAPVLHVPRSAMLSTGRRDLVFVQRPDGMLEPRDVVRGIATDERVEVKSGLRMGETVVASATFLVDAESNLGSMLGGMAGMPGMDMSAPGGGAAGTPPPSAAEDHSKHDMPGMDMSGAKAVTPQTPATKSPAKRPSPKPPTSAPAMDHAMHDMPGMEMPPTASTPTKASGKAKTTSPVKPKAKPDTMPAMPGMKHPNG